MENEARLSIYQAARSIKRKDNTLYNALRSIYEDSIFVGQKGGCIIVDSTRKGKRFPDSMSKTIPIWTCVLNRSILNHIHRMREAGILMEQTTFCQLGLFRTLPLWVSATEEAAIEDRLEGWTRELDESGADIASVALCLKKPLCPLWISQKTIIWLNEVPDYDSWDFTLIILLSTSATSLAQGDQSSTYGDRQLGSCWVQLGRSF